MSTSITLYSYFRSSATWRVRIALAHKGIPYDYEAINLLKKEQKSESYLEQNPRGEVPTMVIDGLTLTQSLPIIEYLEETRPDNPILPKEPGKRAEARRIAECINSGIQPIQNLGVITRVAELSGNPDDKAAWAKFWIHKGFVAVEALLSKSSGRFCVGDDISIADLCLVPQAYNANRFKVDMTEFPNIHRIVSECEKLDAFIAADPKNQPDCPADLK